MKKIIIAIMMLSAIVAKAAEPGTGEGYAVNTFWSNWYVQAGFDMSLQTPHGYKLKDVFPNGKTFGVDIALGKWYTPYLGLRAKLNWENGIRAFENKHANWLAPFYEPGVNLDRGGYITMTGDVQLDLHNIFMGYRPDRMWNFQAFVRAGGLYNFGCSKGSPLIGVGVGSTFKLSARWSVYVDSAIQFVSSGHTGIYKPTQTGTGTSANGFWDFNVGVQYSIGKSTFKKVKR